MGSFEMHLTRPFGLVFVCRDTVALGGWRTCHVLPARCGDLRRGREDLAIVHCGRTNGSCGRLEDDNGH
jgi:hypothetical protein